MQCVPSDGDAEAAGALSTSGGQHAAQTVNVEVAPGGRRLDVPPLTTTTTAFTLFSALAKRLAEKSVSEMAYFVSSGTLNLNSINQSIND